MQTNWIIIVTVLIVAFGLIAYLIRQNQKDKEDVARHFNADASEYVEEDELNNER